MSRAKVAAVVFSVFAVSAALVPLVRPVAAQEAAAAKAAGQPKVRGRVPMYYGQIDLTSNQKTQIYAIQDQYDGRIDDLLTQIEELRVQRDSEIESVLSAGQRAELKKLLDEAKVERVQKQKELESAKKAIEAAKKKK
jgi:Spy/CpxP family protein refolding chaperone